MPVFFWRILSQDPSRPSSALPWGLPWPVSAPEDRACPVLWHVSVIELATLQSLVCSVNIFKNWLCSRHRLGAEDTTTVDRSVILMGKVNDKKKYITKQISTSKKMMEWLVLRRCPLPQDLESEKFGGGERWGALCCDCLPGCSRSHPPLLTGPPSSVNPCGTPLAAVIWAGPGFRAPHSAWSRGRLPAGAQLTVSGLLLCDDGKALPAFCDPVPWSLKRN